MDLTTLTDGALHDLSAQIQARLRKEAYVLHARRYLAQGAPVHPRQQQVIDDLASITLVAASTNDRTSHDTPLSTSSR